MAASFSSVENICERENCQSITDVTYYVKERKKLCADCASKEGCIGKARKGGSNIYCEKHDEEIKLYCETHGEAVCYVCAMIDHPEQSCVRQDIEHAIMESRAKLNILKEKAYDKLRLCRVYGDQIHQCRKDTDTHLQSLKDEVDLIIKEAIQTDKDKEKDDAAKINQETDEKNQKLYEEIQKINEKIRQNNEEREKQLDHNHTYAEKGQEPIDDKQHGLQTDIQVIEEEKERKIGTDVASKTIQPSEGGTIQLPHHGISLCIPALALQTDCKITLKVLPQPSSVLNAEYEAIVSPGVVCEPSGTTFEKPLKLVIPHCAVLTDPSKAKSTMYFTHGDTKVTKKELSPTGTHRCIVKKDNLEVYIDHFSLCEMFMVITDSFIGKRIASTPYLPKSMSRLQPQHCHLRLYNDTPGLEDFIKAEEKDLDYRQMAPTKKMFVLWEKGELKIRCEVDSGHVTENEKTVSLDDIYRLDRNVVSFLVKATGDADVYFKFNFHPHCEEGHAFNAKFSDGDIATNLADRRSSTTPVEPQGATSSATASSVSFDSKAGAQIGSELPATPTRLDDILLYEIAEEIETDEHLVSLMQTLEVTQGSQSRCHELNRLEGRLTARGTRQMMMDWRARTAVIEQRDRLKDALTRAGLLDLRDRFFPG